MNVTCRVPGKLILSGEHSVLHQQPALTVAVPLGLTATLRPQHGARFHIQSTTFGELECSIDEAKQQVATIRQRFCGFQQGRWAIEQVLQHPLHLPLMVLVDTCQMLSFPQGLVLHLDATMPVGSGLGSSAAVIVATIKAVRTLLGMPLATEQWLAQAMDYECYQHGKSSGLDIQQIAAGGMGWMEQGQFQSLSTERLPAGARLTVIHTGQPSVSTGQSVMHAEQQARRQGFDWAQLGQITQAMKTMLPDLLTYPAPTPTLALIQQNHRHLCALGVVPKRIQHWIHQIEQAGGAAKICGAGACRGDAAGMVWVVGLSAEHIQTRIYRPDWQLMSLDLTEFMLL